MNSRNEYLELEFPDIEDYLTMIDQLIKKKKEMETGNTALE